jgi:hypothetical protein
MNGLHPLVLKRSCRAPKTRDTITPPSDTRVSVRRENRCRWGWSGAKSHDCHSPRQCSRNRCLAGWTVWIPDHGRGGGAGRASSKKDWSRARSEFLSPTGVGDRHAYFFKGAGYVRYNIDTDLVDVGPAPIAQFWTHLPEEFQSDLDAVVNWGDRHGPDPRFLCPTGPHNGRDGQRPPKRPTREYQPRHAGPLWFLMASPAVGTDHARSRSEFVASTYRNTGSGCRPFRPVRPGGTS